MRTRCLFSNIRMIGIMLPVVIVPRSLLLWIRVKPTTSLLKIEMPRSLHIKQIHCSNLQNKYIYIMEDFDIYSLCFVSWTGLILYSKSIITGYILLSSHTILPHHTPTPYSHTILPHHTLTPYSHTILPHHTKHYFWVVGGCVPLPDEHIPPPPSPRDVKMHRC